MPENDERTEKSRTRVGVGKTEIERETSGTSSASSRAAGQDDDRDYGYDDDYQSRARRDTRDAGDNVRDAGRAVRRDATDLLSTGCDFLSGIFYGLGDALSPRRRGSSRYGTSYESGGSGGSCLDECGVAFRGYGGAGDTADDPDRGGNPPRSRGDAGIERERVSRSRTVRRTYP